jgi:hypothetical protein
MRKSKHCLLRIAFIGLASIFVSSYSEAADRYVQTNCHMNVCNWSALSGKIIIEKNANGTLVGPTAVECETSHPNGRYPKTYSCRDADASRSEYVAFCSSKFPSIAYKDNSKWLRTKLSISDDGEFGYNIGSITQYLRICHDFVRGPESLDMIGAKFGYKSRIRDLGDNVQDTVDEIHQLVE